MDCRIRFNSAVNRRQQGDYLEYESETSKQKRAHRSEQARHAEQASIGAMTRAISTRELEIQSALQTELSHVDAAVLPALARALERGDDRLIGGTWGIDDDDGCLLTLAARDLGLASGEELLVGSIAAVRIPALFDELWFMILERTGDTSSARRVVHQLVVETLALRTSHAVMSGTPAGASLPESDRSALTR